MSEETLDSVPAYFIAAGIHDSLGNPNSGQGILSSAADVVTKGIPAAAFATYNDLSNIPSNIGNFFQGEGTYETSTTKQRLAEYDTDLANYYEDHKLGIDAAGFLASSIVPGMAGVKVLRGGQLMLREAIGAGSFGGTFGESLGLLAPSHQKYLSKAIESLGSKGNPFSLMEENVAKSLRDGVWQNFMEGAVFTGFVNATMFNTPILNERTSSDLMWDVVTGGVLGGVVGGAIQGVITTSAIKKGLTGIDKELQPWKITANPIESATASDKILVRLHQLEGLPVVDPNSPFAARMADTAAKTQQTLWNEIRGHLNTLTSQDDVAAETLFKTLKNSSFDDNMKMLLESSSITRLGVVSGAEKRRSALLAKHKATLSLTPEEQAELTSYRVSFVDLLTGAVSPDKPAIPGLANKLRKGETISLTPRGDGVAVGSTVYNHNNNPYRAFNITGLPLDAVESRYAWAELSPKLLDDGSHLFHETDIPLLQKALRDGFDKIKVIPEGKAVDEAYLVSGQAQIAQFIKGQQKAVADRMIAGGKLALSTDDLVDKLKGYFGINFNVVDDPAGGYYGFFHRIAGKSGKTGVSADVIAIEKGIGLNRPISEIIRTLKHEEGHSMFQAILDSRGVTRTNLDATFDAAIRDEVMALSKMARPHLWRAKDQASIDYRNNWHEMFADAFGIVSKQPKLLDKHPSFDKFAGHLVRPIPQTVLDDIAVRASTPTAADAARVVNATPEVLSGTVADELQWTARDHLRKMARDVGHEFDPNFTPTTVKAIVKSNLFKDVDGHLLEGMAIVGQKEQLYRDAADKIVMQFLREELPSTAGMRGAPIGASTGSGFLTAENGNYGSWSSFFGYVGQRTHDLIKKTKQVTSDTLTPTLQKMAVQTDDAIEWSVLNEKLRNLPNKYFLNEDGTALVYGKAPFVGDFDTPELYKAALAKYDESVASAVANGMPDSIAIESPLVQKLIADHIQLNNKRRGVLQQININNGYHDRFDEGVFYPIPRNPKNTPHFAYVIDKSVNGTGHSKMIYAKDAQTLETQINSIMTDPELLAKGLKVYTKKEAEEYFKSIGQFEFERTLSDNYINVALARKGGSSSFLPLTDPKEIVNDMLEWHLSRDAATVRTAVEHKYAQEFSGFRSVAAPAIQAASSKFGYISPLSYAQNTVNDPAANLIKLALDITKIDEYPLWANANTYFDSAVSKLTDGIGRLFSKATSTDHLDEINASLRNVGYEGPVVDSALYEAMNGKVARGALTTVVNKVNSLIATFALRSDPMNALNNSVGSAVLLGAETKAVMRAIQGGNAEAVGELAKLMQIKTPGTGDMMTSPTKLIAKHLGGFHSDKVGRQWAKDHGFVTSISEQYDQTLDHIAMAIANGDNAYVQKAMVSLKKLGDGAEKWTANKLVEEMNRYVAAMTMKDITDVAVKHGVLSPDSALSYINTFVNRTQGNYLASQRPIVFQGPIGQAIGLFQTYQFNMLQQIFRYVGEGQGKEVAVMMGLQASIYGLNGLPAFNAINTHIIGSAGGNTQHKTMYDAIFSGAGKDAGEWLLYGGLSNGLGAFHPDLKINMYSRGDINPRHVTLLPLDPSKTPIYQATERFFANSKEMYQKIQAGGDVWSTFLRGVEQNGISRPLTGIAQILEAAGRDDKKVISMNQQGNMLMAHDLYSLSSLARIAGAKPLDEAIVNDTMFRVNTYRTADAAKRKVLGEAIKLSILGGNEPDEAQISDFAKTYARTGGKQAEFAQFMAQQYKNANISQAEQLRRRLGAETPTALQTIMNDGE